MELQVQSVSQPDAHSLHAAAVPLLQEEENDTASDIYMIIIIRKKNLLPENLVHLKKANNVNIYLKHMNIYEHTHI